MSSALGNHLLGREVPQDWRHVELHPHEAAPPPPKTIEVEIKRPLLSVYDQGSTPRCVGYSTSKVMNWFNKMAYDADWLYAECKKIDGYPGDGTSARYACDVLRTKGHLQMSGKPLKDVAAGPLTKHGIGSNTWATSVDGIRSVFARATPQPVLLGIDWYEAWFNPILGDARGGDWLQDIQHAGQVAGGHEIGLWAWSDHLDAGGLSNTWGNLFPDLVWVSRADLEVLLAAGGDACVLNDLRTR